MPRLPLSEIKIGDEPLTDTLTNAAKYYAVLFIEDRQTGEVTNHSKHTTGLNTRDETLIIKKFSRDWVMLQIHNFAYKDEFEFIVAKMKNYLGAEPLAIFEAELAKLPARSDATFEAILKQSKPAGFKAEE